MAISKDDLYYIQGSRPTAEELAKAEALGIVRFRNASLVSTEDTLEPCKRVAGLVPKGYAKMKGVTILPATGSPPPSKNA